MRSLIQKDKKAALEMSVGTIVTIVLMVSMLVLGLVLIRTIFFSAKGAISQIDQKVKDQINKLFQEDDRARIAIYPSDRRITISQGTNNEGFAFSIRNKNTEATSFTYVVEPDPNYNPRICSSSLTIAELNRWILIPTGSIDLAASSIQELPQLVVFDIPENAPRCTIPYKVGVKVTGGEIYTSAQVLLTIKGA